CGKIPAEVRKLIAGPGVYICDSCIDVCNGILDRELGKDAPRRLADRWRTLLQYLIGLYRTCLEYFQKHVLDKAPFVRGAQTQPEEERLPGRVSVTFDTRYKVEISLGLYQCLISNATIAKQMRSLGFFDISVSGTGRNRVAEAKWATETATIVVKRIATIDK